MAIDKLKMKKVQEFLDNQNLTAEEAGKIAGDMLLTGISKAFAEAMDGER